MRNGNLITILTALLLTGIAANAQSFVYTGVNTHRLWTETADLQHLDENDRMIFPVEYGIYEIDMPLMQDVVEATTAVIDDDERKVITMMFMPMPNGDFQRFEIWNDPIMHSDLAARFPEISTFKGRGVDDPTATIRLDKTPQGVHGQILSANGTVYLDPYATSDDGTYIVYSKEAYRPHPSKVRVSDHVISVSNTPPASINSASANELRTYRLALACTGEYSAFHGGTVLGAMSGMTTTMNRVNGIFERDLSVRMELIANNDELIYLDGTTDPYTNGSGSAMLNENQDEINFKIGSSNYDIGHVFSTGGGGVAFLGSVCTSNKARGVTGGNSPVGDPFDVDYVAHEIGHQFNGEHSWNYCGSPFGTGSTDFEPGGGSTIMGYAGLCGGDDYAIHSDAYFHGGNVEQMYTFVTAGVGSSCGDVTSTANLAPVITKIPDGYTIPVSTPFKLNAEASDPDGDIMTYCWEQVDGGFNSSLTTNPSGLSPLFRSFSPVESSERIFPRMDLIVAGNVSRVEYLADYSRSMNFQITIRDNSINSAGLAWEKLTVEVSDAGGPFTVTGPSGPGVVWEVGQWVPVTWEKGVTDLAPFNVSSVRILMSVDGGLTYPITLADEVANNGNTYVYVPDMESDQVRIQVAANDNIFFNINDENLKIENNGTASGIDEIAEVPLNLYPNPATDRINISVGPSDLKTANLIIRIVDATGRTMLVRELPYYGAGFQQEINVADWPSGIYHVEVGGATAHIIKH